MSEPKLALIQANPPAKRQLRHFGSNTQHFVVSGPDLIRNAEISTTHNGFSAGDQVRKYSREPVTVSVGTA